jgi:hypothetical protein
MRQLIENRVVEILDDIAREDIEYVGDILESDLGCWNVDDGTAMSREVYTQLVSACSDEQLASLYETVVVVYNR